MDVEALKQKILDLAIRGKLVPQDPNDESASVLIEKIREEKAKLVKEGKIKASKEESYIYKGSDNCYYEKVPKNWVCIKLGEIITLKSGIDLPLSKINEKNEGTPYLTGASCFSNDNIKIVRWTKFPTNISKKGDILITVKGTIGQMSFNNYGDIHIARQIMAITTDELINQEYIYYVLKSKINELLEKSGGLIPGITRETILSLDLLLPPIVEQKRIVDVLKEYLNKMTIIGKEFHEISELVLTLKKRILDSVFGENSSYKSYYEKTVKFSELYNIISTTDIEVKTRDILPVGEIPVVSQSHQLIDGYIDYNQKVIVDLPVIVFGDHTRNVKYIDFKFLPGADGTKILKAKNINDKFFYYCTLYASGKIDNNGYARHFSKLKEVSINLPNLESQERLVNYLDTSFSLLNFML